MKHLLRSLFALSMLASSAIVSADGNHVAADTTHEMIATIANEIYAQGLYPGISIAALAPDGERIQYQIGHADLANARPVTAGTSFRMYSVSKGLTRILAAVLVDKSKLDLEARVGDYLPEVPAHLFPITVQQLLDHTSGIRHYRGADEWVELSRKSCSSPLEAVAEFSQDPLLFEPGSRKSYSSFGYVLLSAVLEKAGGEPFGSLLQRYVSNPSGARDVELDRPQEDNQEDNQEHASVFYERRAAEQFDVAFKVDNSCKFGGGAVNASSSAILDVYRAFYSGELTSSATLEAFAPTDNRAGERPYISVGGEGLGGRSVAAAYPTRNVIVVIAANARGGNLEPYARRIADALLENADH